MPVFPELFIVGKPRAKGSMIPAVTKEGKPFLRMSSDFELTRWQHKIEEAITAEWGAQQLDGAIFVSCEFVCPRPSQEYHEKDVDKLVRTALDALTRSRVIRDDKQVALLLAMKYHVRADAVLPGLKLQLASLESSHHAATRFVEAVFERQLDKTLVLSTAIPKLNLRHARAAPRTRM